MILICSECGQLYNSHHMNIVPYEGMYSIDYRCPKFKCGGVLYPLDDNCVDNILQLQKKGYRTHFSCSLHPYDSAGSNCYVVFSIKRNELTPALESEFSKLLENINELQAKEWHYRNFKCLLELDYPLELADPDRYYIWLSMTYSDDKPEEYYKKVHIIAYINEFMHFAIDMLPDLNSKEANMDLNSKEENV